MTERSRLRASSSAPSLELADLYHGKEDRLDLDLTAERMTKQHMACIHNHIMTTQ